jgi:hypothetical protein
MIVSKKDLVFFIYLFYLFIKEYRGRRASRYAPDLRVQDKQVVVGLGPKAKGWCGAKRWNV